MEDRHGTSQILHYSFSGIMFVITQTFYFNIFAPIPTQLKSSSNNVQDGPLQQKQQDGQETSTDWPLIDEITSITLNKIPLSIWSKTTPCISKTSFFEALGLCQMLHYCKMRGFHLKSRLNNRPFVLLHMCAVTQISQQNQIIYTLQPPENKQVWTLKT